MKSATNETIAYAKRLAQDLAECDADCAVLSVLFDMMVPVNFDGFEYLKTAVVMQYTGPTRDLVNDIYRIIAEQYGVTPEMVASAIRGAIRAGWTRASRRSWYRSLPTIPRDRSGAPTNAEVIAGLARFLELWRGCSAAYLRQKRKEVVSSGRK